MGRTARQPKARSPLFHRSARVTAILVAALVAPTITAAPATAAGPLPSTTTVTAKPASSTVGTQVTLSATVSVLGLPGLGVTPTGSVAFTATNGIATAALGSALLGPCLLTACTATLTTTSLPVGTRSVRGTYGGDVLLGTSSGTAPVTVAPNPNPGRSATVTCYAAQPCDTGVITGTSTTLRVVVDPSAGNQTVTASLDHGGQLHCVFGGRPDRDGDSDDGVPFEGDLATFSSTAADASKTIYYTGSGSVGARMLHEYIEARTLYAGCYGAPHAFLGYVGGVYTNAKFVPADGLFEAQLSNCANNGGQRPCFTNIQGPGSTDTYRVRTQPGDPKFIG
jgi:hypothetical protein